MHVVLKRVERAGWARFRPVCHVTQTRQLMFVHLVALETDQRFDTESKVRRLKKKGYRQNPMSNKLVWILVLVFVILAILRPTMHCMCKNVSARVALPPTRRTFETKTNANERTCLRELVRTVGDIFKKRNITWMPCCGNLLAIYRHKNWLIPWDDDFDLVVHHKQHEDALRALEEDLPSGMKLSKHNSPSPQWGALYKVSFTPDHPDYGPVLYRHGNYTWPFVDVFIGGTETGAVGVRDIDDDELPLREFRVDGLTLYHPSRGSRSMEAFAKQTDLMKMCKDVDYMHKYERSVKTNGSSEMPCANVPSSNAT